MADDTITEFSLAGEATDEEKEQKKILQDISMCFEENRKKTFVEWPFSEPAKCTADAVSILHITFTITILLLY